MNVTLISYDEDAADILTFTKQTRLGLDPGRLDAVKALSQKDKEDVLSYMADTIPSSWEFASYTFLITGVSRAFTHQFVRTRTGSYAQQSLRVTNQSDYDFVMPDRIKIIPRWRNRVDQLNHQIQELYREMVENGIPEEDARAILPTNVATNIVARFNLRTLCDLVKSRSGGRTQSEYQAVINLMADEVLAVHPWTERFLFGRVGRDYFTEIEAYAQEKFPNDLAARGQLLKIVDKMRKEFA